MKASELRIRNLVYLSDKQKVWEIWNAHEIDECENNPFVEPVPLTEEWFFRFGFKKEMKAPSHNHSNYYSIGVVDSKYSFSYASFREDWGFYHSYTDAPKDEDNDRYDFISCGIKYVHQLQNLYFALTGEELIDGGNK